MAANILRAAARHTGYENNKKKAYISTGDGWLRRKNIKWSTAVVENTLLSAIISVLHWL